MDLLAEIKRALPWGQNPEFIDDLVADVALLVVEGRIRTEKLAEGIKRHLPALRRKYHVGNDISLDQPIGEDGLTLKDVLLRPGLGKKGRCPNCRGVVARGRTYCRPSCAYGHYQKQNRKIDPKEFAKLHREKWLGRDELAAIFGVTRHGVNNVVSRHRLSRKLPETCKVEGCNEAALRYRHCKGWLAGNLCVQHKREAQNRYSKESRQRRHPPLTPEERKEHARKASIARWTNEKWNDPLIRKDFSLKISGRSPRFSETRSEEP